MHHVFSVTSMESVRQPFRHPAIVNPLTGWLGQQLRLFAGGIYRFMSWHLKIYQRILWKKKKKRGPVVLNPFDPCLLTQKVSFSMEDVQS